MIAEGDRAPDFTLEDQHGNPVSLSGLGTLYMAAGAGNQRLYLLPDQDMVIVRQADGIRNTLRRGAGDWSDQTFLSLVVGV